MPETIASHTAAVYETIVSYTVAVYAPSVWTAEERRAWLRVGGAGLLLELQRSLAAYRADHPEVRLDVTFGGLQP
jgi:hypothetical protein